MYVNNIAERSSSRVLQRPGGAQSINIFGGGDDAPPEERRRGKGHVAAPVPVERSTEPPVRAALQNNIWSSDEPAAPAAPAARQAAGTSTAAGSSSGAIRSSTRVVAQPGGGSQGVSAIFGGGADAQPAQPRYSNRGNTTSAESPFSNAPQPDTQSANAARAASAQRARGAGNIISWQ